METPLHIFVCAFSIFFVMTGCEKDGAVQSSGHQAQVDSSSEYDTASGSDSEKLAPPPSSDDDTETELKPLTIITELPTGFTHANAVDTDSSYGGFSVVGPLHENVVHEEDSVCANVIRVVMRDFKMEHTDYQDDWTTSKVEPLLGPDQKPVAAEGNTSKIETDWYRNIDGVNMPLAVDLWLEPLDDMFIFYSGNFFPLDGEGFPESYSCCEDGSCEHNYHFSTEMHANFQYNGGEEFTFIGDDDVYVFINNQLVIDLGGVHEPQTDTVILDEVAEDLNLQVGEVYPIDLFQAERQWCGSTFRIETTLDFSGCGIILSSDIVPE
ncbi:MAG: fibro-slime domain-containing protein [Deltaproteobacteria bacterium]|nr:fibro-slime domain-containing protein [Deltaproteobacteria bacterium]